MCLYQMGGQGNSPASSIDSSNTCLSSTSVSQTRGDLSTDLRLGLSISTSSCLLDSSTASNEHHSNCQPIKPLFKSTLSGTGRLQNPANFFVKVYMDGFPIGRKLDLYAHRDYNGLIRTLSLMFQTTITLMPELGRVSNSRKAHVLTYKDKDGDWMVVGDLPWQIFLASVKRMKITRADRC